MWKKTNTVYENKMLTFWSGRRGDRMMLGKIAQEFIYFLNTHHYTNTKATGQGMSGKDEAQSSTVANY